MDDYDQQRRGIDYASYGNQYNSSPVSKPQMGNPIQIGSPQFLSNNPGTSRLDISNLLWSHPKENPYQMANPIPTAPGPMYNSVLFAQNNDLNDMLNQSPETQFLGKPQATPKPSPTPAPVKRQESMYG